MSHEDSLYSLYAQANILAESGRLEAALDAYRAALENGPEHVETLTNGGITLARLRRFEEAEAWFRRAIALCPGFARAHHNLGVALAQAGRPEEALGCWKVALHHDPDYVEAFLHQGHTLTLLGKRAEALLAYRHALARRPEDPDVLATLGRALTEFNKPGEAVVYLQQAIRLRPQDPDLLNALGLALNDMGHMKEAIEIYDRALQSQPCHPGIHANRGSALKGLSRLDEAIACYEYAQLLDPGASAWNLSLALLQRGDYERGWALYEDRLRVPDERERLLETPRWRGESIRGKTILVHCEQGLGDAIQFVRYIPQLKEYGPQILLQCHAILAPLLRTIPGLDGLTREGDAVPTHDVHVSLLSLPHRLRTTLATIPANIPYLIADPERARSWQTRLASQPGPRVGLCWQGNPYHKWDRFRSIPLRKLLPVLGVPGVAFVALQKEFGREQIVEMASHYSLADYGEELGQPPGFWHDTASLISSLDLVITVDTAVAHLAGALGKATWLLLPKGFVDSRWLLDRTDSPWYPTMRIFRQHKPNDWASVILEVEEALRIWTCKMGSKSIMKEGNGENP